MELILIRIHIRPLEITYTLGGQQWHWGQLHGKKTSEGTEEKHMSKAIGITAGLGTFLNASILVVEG